MKNPLGFLLPRNVVFLTVTGVWTSLGGSLGSPAEAEAQVSRPSVDVPRVHGAPDLQGLTNLTSFQEALEGFARVTGFVQQLPQDGRAAVHETVAYLGYDQDAFHVVFLALDSSPGLVRARLSPRENVWGDDVVTLMLDTDDDGRRAYTFRCNGRGVQWDALLTEGQGVDVSFDAVWESEGRVTEWGYVVRMEIPFLTLRFEPGDLQTWRLVLSRNLARDSEESTFWPRVSSEVEGILTQSATLTGIRDISPGRNLQAIPYGTFRSFRAVDYRAQGGPRFVTDRSDPEMGGDFKAVLNDRFVLDVTANPDFSQVESDQPQVTVNQRFEVFFPERRPFFMENADYFRTPVNLLFTRRIRDPRVGARFTGRTGGWGIGALTIDDAAAGELAAPGTPGAEESAFFAAARVTREVGEASSVGGMYVGREHGGSHNRTGGVDARIRFNDHWTASGQAVRSTSGGSGVDDESGSAYFASLSRFDRRLFLTTSYMDVSPDYQTQSGFVPRTGIRRLSHFSSFFWRPEDRAMTSWGPELSTYALWDHEGTMLEESFEVSLEWNFISNSGLEVNYRRSTEHLRPEDHPALNQVRDYETSTWDIEYRTNWWDWLRVDGNLLLGHQTNFNPAQGAEPEAGDWTRSNLTVGFQPTTRLRIDNTLIWSRLTDPASDQTIFTDGIIRSRWNWQWSRELAVRAILQYEDTDSDSRLTSIEPRRRFNADLLVSYRLTPWTAIYAGVNANALNRDLIDPADGDRYFVRTPDLRSDGRQFFLKLTYLLRI